MRILFYLLTTVIGLALLIVLIPLIILILLIQLAFGGQFIRIKRFGPGRRTTPPPRPSSPRTDVPASEDVIDAVAVLAQIVRGVFKNIGRVGERRNQGFERGVGRRERFQRGDGRIHGLDCSSVA